MLLQVFPGTKGATFYEGDSFYDNFNMDEVDLDIENYEELFSAALDNTEQLFDDDGIDGLFGTKDMSVSNCRSANAAEVILKWDTISCMWPLQFIIKETYRLIIIYYCCCYHHHYYFELLLKKFAFTMIFRCRFHMIKIRI